MKVSSLKVSLIDREGRRRLEAAHEAHDKETAAVKAEHEALVKVYIYI